MGPSLAFKHLEHFDLFLGERISLDCLTANAREVFASDVAWSNAPLFHFDFLNHSPLVGMTNPGLKALARLNGCPVARPSNQIQTVA